MVLAQVLIIALSGVPFSSSQLYGAYLFSAYVSISILGLMLPTLVFACWRRRGDPDLPRTPGGIVLLWSYLCWSDALLASFVPLSGLGSREMHREVVSWEKRYVLKKTIVTKEDVPLETWMVDEDREEDVEVVEREERKPGRISP